MADTNRRAGRIKVTIAGTVREAVGSFTYNLGQPKREALVGADKVHGYKEMPQVAFIEGEIRDASDLDLAAFQNITDATFLLELANGKSIVLRNAWYAADGNIETEEANIEVRFEGIAAEELKANV